MKVMYMGVVGNPQPQHDFNGRVLFKSVSTKVTAKRWSYHTKYTVDVHVNDVLKKGNMWREFITPLHLGGNLINEIVSVFDLDEYVLSRLVICYLSHTTGGGNTKWVILSENQMLLELGMKVNGDGTHVPITKEDLQLIVQVNVGDKFDEDISCDSEFMLTSIPEVGRALRDQYHWIPPSEPVYLLMDNAGEARHQ